MDRPVSRIVIVGGGTAGWLAACLIAARANPSAAFPLEVTLIESPDVPTIGVGEGTWPTMRGTLERIGIDERHFLLACDASFKQGSRFDGWLTGQAGDSYYHPFVAPPAGQARALLDAWRGLAPDAPFAFSASSQPAVCQARLAPRQRAMPDYAGALNYAYHFDAGKFAALLASHAKGALGVRHVADHVTTVGRDESGDISHVGTRGSGEIAGDLFIDCTGHSALLIGGELDVPLVDRSDTLFNDRALAAQVPLGKGSPIESQTIGTAHEAGWIWDIGLASRRGIGCVYSSRHMSDDAAAERLKRYIDDLAISNDARSPQFRQLKFRSAHRARFWERNCIAVGLSAGFVEPLEASAIVLIELSLEALLDNFPRDRDAMQVRSRRFNTLFSYRWERIVDFLKLHYVLSKRDEPYWLDHRDPASLPDSLAELLELWRDQPPSDADLAMANEVFPAASYQYVLLGMGGQPSAASAIRARGASAMTAALRQVQDRTRSLTSALPTNRAYLDALRASCEPGRAINLEMS